MCNRAVEDKCWERKDSVQRSMREICQEDKCQDDKCQYDECQQDMCQEENCVRGAVSLTK